MPDEGMKVNWGHSGGHHHGDVDFQTELPIGIERVQPVDVLGRDLGSGCGAGLARAWLCRASAEVSLAHKF